MRWVQGIALVTAFVAAVVGVGWEYWVTLYRIVRSYTRLDLPEPKSTTIHHILCEAMSQRPASGHMLLKSSWPHKFYVVDCDAWIYKYIQPNETELSALYQTAERFDTLEQAMLYFEVVRP
jgi:hypothetical protein